MYTNGGKTVTAAKRALFITCEFVRTVGKPPDIWVYVSTVIQLAYTTLFGYHCAFLFLRTGSLYPPLFSHMFCNFMGLPQIVYELRAFPHRKAGECLHFSGWAAVIERFATVIIFAYVLGVIGYAYTMRNWTLDADSLYWQDRLKRY